MTISANLKKIFFFPLQISGQAPLTVPQVPQNIIIIHYYQLRYTAFSNTIHVDLHMCCQCCYFNQQRYVYQCYLMKIAYEECIWYSTLTFPQMKLAHKVHTPLCDSIWCMVIIHSSNKSLNPWEYLLTRFPIKMT